MKNCFDCHLPFNVRHIWDSLLHISSPVLVLMLPSHFDSHVFDFFSLLLSFLRIAFLIFHGWPWTILYIFHGSVDFLCLSWNLLFLHCILYVQAYRPSNKSCADALLRHIWQTCAWLCISNDRDFAGFVFSLLPTLDVQLSRNECLTIFLKHS